MKQSKSTSVCVYLNTRSSTAILAYVDPSHLYTISPLNFNYTEISCPNLQLSRLQESLGLFGASFHFQIEPPVLGYSLSLLAVEYDFEVLTGLSRGSGVGTTKLNILLGFVQVYRSHLLLTVKPITWQLSKLSAIPYQYSLILMLKVEIQISG